ncbi:MAG: hypothetical protein ACI38A_05250 [Candidatus Ornithomonoglobus sp.]
MDEAKRRIMENSITVKRDPDAYKRYLHNKARYEKYGPGKRMDLDMKPPKPERTIKIQLSDEQCRMLAALFKSMIDNGELSLEDDEE